MTDLDINFQDRVAGRALETRLAGRLATALWALQ